MSHSERSRPGGTPGTGRHHRLRGWHLAASLALAVATLASVPSGAPVAAAPGPPVGEIRVVSIGDSFMAGNGATNYYEGQGPGFPDSGGPRVPGPGRNCYQSYSSYPWQYVQMLEDAGLPAAIWHAACGGAWTNDLLPQWQTVPEEWRSSAGLVLISAGGNDAGFGDLVAHCLLSLPGGDECDQDLAEAEAAIDGIVERLRGAAGQIADDAPQAQIVLVGYPLLASPAKQRCLSRGEAELDALQWRHEVALRVLADDLNRATGSFRHRAVSVTGRFVDRGPCAWAGALLHGPSADAAERFHPTWWGANAYARALFDLRIHEPVGGTDKPKGNR